MEGSSNAGGLATLQQRRRTEYIQGIFLLLLVVILWTASNFLTNTVLTNGYDKPFAVTYANTSSFALYLLPFVLTGSWRRRSRRPTRKPSASVAETIEPVPRFAWLSRLGFELPVHDDAARGTYKPIPSQTNLFEPVEPSLQSRLRRASSSSSENLNPHDGFRPRLSSALSAVAPPRPSSIDGRRPRTDINLLRSDNGSILEAQGTTLANASPSLPPLSLAETAWLAAQFMVVWFGANWSINAGLGLTSVASGTTIGSASGFFTLAIGCLLGVDHFTYGRLGAVSMSFLGVLLVTWADTETVDGKGLTRRDMSQNPSSTLGSPVNAPLGDALALLSAFLYSIYVMMLKVKIGSEDRISMPLFFGFVGAFNIIALWPIGLLLHLTGIEPFQLPPNAATWLGVVVNMSITFVSDLVYLLAMLKSSPLATTLGLSLTIPLALAGDILRGSHSGGLQAGLGSVMVLLSFLAIGLADNAAMQNEILAATSATHLPGPAVPLSTSASSIRSYSANGSAFTSRNSEDLSSEDEDGARLSSGDTRGRSSIRT